MANKEADIGHTTPAHDIMSQVKQPPPEWLRKNFALPSGFQLTVDHETYTLLHERENKERCGEVKPTTSGRGLYDPPPAALPLMAGKDGGSHAESSVGKDPRWKLLLEESSDMIANAHLYEELRNAVESAKATSEVQDEASERASEKGGAEAAGNLQASKKQMKAQHKKKKNEKNGSVEPDEQAMDECGSTSQGEEHGPNPSVGKETDLINPVPCDFCDVGEAESSRFQIMQIHLPCGDGRCTGVEKRYTSCFPCVFNVFNRGNGDDQETSPGYLEPPPKTDALVALCDVCDTEITSTGWYFKRTQQPKQTSTDLASMNATGSNPELEANTSSLETSTVDPKYYRICQNCNETYLPQCTAGGFSMQLRPIPKVKRTDSSISPNSTSPRSSASSSGGMPEPKTSSGSSAASVGMPDTPEDRECTTEIAMVTVTNEVRAGPELPLQHRLDDPGQTKKRPISPVEETFGRSICTNMSQPESTECRSISKKAKRKASTGKQAVAKADEMVVNSKVKLIATGPIASDILQEHLDSSLMAQCMVLAHRISGPDSCEAFLATWQKTHIIPKLAKADPLLAQSHSEICDRILAAIDTENLNPHALAKMYKLVFLEAPGSQHDTVTGPARRAVAVVRRHGCAETQQTIDELKFKAYSSEFIQEGPWKQSWPDALRGFRDVLQYKLARVRANPEIVPWQWADSIASLEPFGNICKIEGSWVPYSRFAALQDMRSEQSASSTLNHLLLEQRNGVVMGRLKVLLQPEGDGCERRHPVFRAANLVERWCLVEADVQGSAAGTSSPARMKDDAFWKGEGASQPRPVTRTRSVSMSLRRVPQELAARLANNEGEARKLPLDLFVVPQIPWLR